MQSIECEHRPDWIREREDGERYCAVCRIILYEEFDVGEIEESSYSFGERDISSDK